MSGHIIATLYFLVLFILGFCKGDSILNEYYLKENKGYVGLPTTKRIEVLNLMKQTYDDFKTAISQDDDDDFDDYDDPKETGSNWARWCKLPPRKGFCNKNLNRYYFDVKEKWCKPFVYGGCFGNKNNFKSYSACRKRCRRGVKINKVFRPLFCYHPAKPGHCNAYIERYYFDERTKTCQQFVYGGCGGNENRFRTLKKCQDVCKVKKNIL